MRDDGTQAQFGTLFPATGGALYGAGGARPDGDLPPAGQPHETAGPVSGRGQHASGGGCPDGGPLGPSGSSQPDRGWRFDKPVAPHGYEWWYIDALSDDGQHGFTLIAFIGSVFSPWYRLARRRGGGDPAQHCAMNFSLYGRQAALGDDRARRKSALQRDADTIWQSARHPCAGMAPRSPPTIERNHRAAANTPARHHPPSPARPGHPPGGAGRRGPPSLVPGRARRPRGSGIVRTRNFSWQGHAYFDTNAGDEPLEECFTRWDWCRAKLHNGVAVIYHGDRIDGTRFCTALRYDTGGQAQDFDPPPAADLGRNFWGMRMGTLADSGTTPRVVKKLEDAPFYARSVISTRLCGQDVTAVHESLSLPRFTAPWVQLMLPFKAPRALWRPRRLA